jgi:non-homologous end joining protein Ku
VRLTPHGRSPDCPEQHPRKAQQVKPTTTTGSAKKPTRKQLDYLRSLAEQTATTFTPPRYRDEASDEIDRLLNLSSSRADRTREQRAVQRDLAERPDDATRIRDDEISGYASSARWTHHASNGKRS